MLNEHDPMIKAIVNGTVVDHVPPESLMDIIAALRLNESKIQWLSGNYLPTGKIEGGRKALIKVKDHYFTEPELYLLSLFAPDATVNVIKDSVIEKHKIKVPDRVDKLIRCMNPTCITNKPGEPFETSFGVSKGENGAPVLTCKYCRKTTTQFKLK